MQFAPTPNDGNKKANGSRYRKPVKIATEKENERT